MLPACELPLARCGGDSVAGAAACFGAAAARRGAAKMLRPVPVDAATARGWSLTHALLLPVRP